MKPKKSEGDSQGGKWLLTFNDMVTLLLTFFVLILSLSKLDAPKLEELASSMRSVFNLSERGAKEDVEVFNPFVKPLGRGGFMENRSLDIATGKLVIVDLINGEAQRLGKSLAAKEASFPEGESSFPWEKAMEARIVDEGVSVALGEQMLFRTGSAEIGGADQPLLKALCSILRETDCQIEVEGNTDDVPIGNEIFQSNWELSAARAVSVVKYFISEGSIAPERLSAAGYADSRPRAAVVEDKSRDLNRRVEVLLKFNSDEGEIDNG